MSYLSRQLILRQYNILLDAAIDFVKIMKRKYSLKLHASRIGYRHCLKSDTPLK